MICKECKKEYKKWHNLTWTTELCLECNDKKWEQWKIEEADNLEKVKELQKKGHSHHCACRQVWGDSECECHLYKKGYDPYAWMVKIYKENK